MSQDLERYLELLNSKLAAAKRVLEISQAADFSDSVPPDDQAEQFANLYARRENIVGRIMKIDDELNRPDFEDYKDDKAATEVIMQISEVAGQIIALDKEYAKVSARLTEELKDGMKKLRQGTNISNAYSDDYEGNRGQLFDTKN